MEKNKSIKRAAVVLSGCGVYDGSEIHEAVITLLALLRNGIDVEFFAPNIASSDCVNHIDGSAETPRNVLIESARIARGNITPLSTFNAENFDMILFPGGFGAAKNLCTFAYDGANCVVEESVKKAILSMYEAGKKLGFICIAPVIAAKVISNGVKITIGNDAGTAEAINAMGGQHVECTADSFVQDGNVFSTPAYMLAENAAVVEVGVSKMVSKMSE